MSKELTEQWRNGTLPDAEYYVKNKSNDVIVDYYCELTKSFASVLPFNVKEVLSPVPKYDQFVELTEKVEQLKKDNKYLKSGIETRDKQIEQLVKQLKEENKIIKKLYKESGNPIGCGYLEKWGVK